MGKVERRKWKAEFGDDRPRCAPTFPFPHSPFRRGLTLIELLVVIVILTTLVAGVIPILSPNNDARKIRECSRMLQTYIMLAQAEAASTGREQGIAFRESSPGSATTPGSGYALEVFRLDNPPPYAGFSSASRVAVTPIAPTTLNYGSDPTLGNGGIDFRADYDGHPLYSLEFRIAPSPPVQFDPFPPRTIKIGDQIDVEGNLFLIVDDGDPTMAPNEVETVNGVEYLTYIDGPPVVLHCIWLNSDSDQILPPPTALKFYQIIGQPSDQAVMPYVSAEAPLQLLSGIAIDLQGSVVEGDSTFGWPANNSLNTNLNNYADTVGIMFSPSGAVSKVIFNGTTSNNISRIVLLLGRIENGGLALGDWNISATATNDELAELQERVNWLNLDSRWLTIGARYGQVVVAQNAFVDARAFGSLAPLDQAAEQIEAAHEFAHTMEEAGNE